MAKRLHPVLALMTICSCAGVRSGIVPVVPPDTGAVAELQSAGLVVVFPWEPRGDSGWGLLKVANRYGGYFWHVRVRVAGRWLAAGLQVDPDSDLVLPAYSSLRAVVAAGALRSCRLDSHVIACAGAIEGRAWVNGDHVVMAITDRRWRRALAAAHPDSVWLSRGEQNTYSLNVSVPLTYR